MIRISLKHGGRPGSLRSTQWTTQEHRNDQKKLRVVKANTVGHKCLDGQKRARVSQSSFLKKTPEKVSDIINKKRTANSTRVQIVVPSCWYPLPVSI